MKGLREIVFKPSKNTAITSIAGTKHIFFEYLWRNKASRTLFAKWPKYIARVTKWKMDCGIPDKDHKTMYTAAGMV